MKQRRFSRWWGGLCAALCLLCLGVGLEAGTKGEIALEEEGGVSSPRKRGGKVVALLVGLNRYKDKRFRSLRYAEKDARDMKRYLESVGVKSRDIKLLVGKQATLVKVKSALGKWLRQRARRKDAVFVFVSTHGEKLEHGNFLVMYDSDAANLEYSGLSGSFLESTL
ncbi:MAG: caspase family protein, partial [Xanthomonadales bacterium]|nr:caspase family protein [Xanthomonadales bacterium]